MIMTHKKNAKRFDLTSAIIAWESGELSDDETVELFQHLVDTGDAWRLQGMYGRQASAMLEAGLIHPPKNKNSQNSTDYYGNRLW
jgi:hypothetical protein